KKIKDFTFCIKLKDYELTNDEFLLKDGLSFYVSTSNYETGLYIYNGLVKLKEFQYKNYELKKADCYLVKEKQINIDEVIFKTLSPLVIKDSNNTILDVNDENFEKELNYLANNIILSIRGKSASEKFSFENINLKRVVVKEEIAEFTEKTGKKFYNVNALNGLFKLRGNREDLNLLYKTGLSFRKSQGFGMLEVEGV
ncbi:MAG: CRISPR-associated endoribonuclease Cas6, partial [Oscillospiraceae bacterium]|nr:CRISPR-associated endoribonuclease Cas6 [Oscillospiraceae bacterium]